MDTERRRMDDEKWDRVFDKLDALTIEQTKQGEDISHINSTLFKNNGEVCVVTRLDELNKSIQELKDSRLKLVTTGQAVWTLIFGFLSIAGTVSAILLTINKITGK